MPNLDNIAKKQKAFFIVFEGPDGCGKNLQARMLSEHFQKIGLKAHETLEPVFFGKNGEKIRRILKKQEQTSALSLQKMFVKDRKYHLSKIIKPCLKKGVSVISVRYVLSTIAYGALSENFETLARLNHNFPSPDFTFILKTSPEICLKRICKRRKKNEFFEKTKILKKVLVNYLKAAKTYPNVFILNGNKNPRQIHKNVLKIIKNGKI